KIGHAGEEWIGVEGLRIERLTTGKGQQAVGEGRRAVGAGESAVDESIEFPGFAAADAPLQDAEGTGDALQEVVEVVGDAAGELTEGFHLLRLAQLILRRFQGFRALLDTRLKGF